MSNPLLELGDNRILFAEKEQEKNADYLRSYIDRNQVQPKESMIVTFERSTVEVTKDEETKKPISKLSTRKVWEFYTTAERVSKPSFEKGIADLKEMGWRFTGATHGGPHISRGMEQDRFSRDIQGSLGKQIAESGNRPWACDGR